MDEEENARFVEELFDRENDKILQEYADFKNAMQWYFGEGRCFEALEQYRIEQYGRRN